MRPMSSSSSMSDQVRFLGPVSTAGLGKMLAVVEVSLHLERSMSCARLIREVGPASGSGFGASLARPAGTRHRRALYTFSRAPAASVSYDVFRIFDQYVKTR